MTMLAGFIAVYVAVMFVVAFLTLALLVPLMLAGEFVLARLPLGRPAKYAIMILRGIRRNPLRTMLTYVAIFILINVLTMVLSGLYFMDQITTEASKDLKAIVTERWQIPSQMPLSYAASLTRGAARNPGDREPQDYMTWQFFGGSIDPEKRTRENIVFFFAMDPDKIVPMMDDAANFDPAVIEKLKARKNGAILGRDRLKALQRKVGDRIVITSFNYKDIVLEFEIVGECPPGRYDMSAFMQRDYLNDALDAYERQKGQKHDMVQKTLNLVWLRVPDNAAFQQVAAQVMNSPEYSPTAVKCETASTGIGPWLEGYKTFLDLFKYGLVPAALITMMLVVANAISISVRERWTEMAVLKVLGFGPVPIFFLVLGEALLIGTLSGLFSSGLTWLLINGVLGGVKFPIAFFPVFFIPVYAVGWGLVMSTGTALIGSVWPALSAQRVKPSEVFAKVA